MMDGSLLRGSPGLLVSVQDSAEAELALRGGAEIIDVKAPQAGSLGKADDATINAVIRQVAARAPVTAAMGELLETSNGGGASIRKPGLHLLKFGLAGCSPVSDWRDRLASVSAGLISRLVAVVYVDWRRAEAPDPEQVTDFAMTHACGAILFDTWRKDGSTLCDWIDLGFLADQRQILGAARIPVVLAGGLSCREIPRLVRLAPDWFAVRGAACRQGDRGAMIDIERVRELADAIHPVQT